MLRICSAGVLCGASFWSACRRWRTLLIPFRQLGPRLGYKRYHQERIDAKHGPSKPACGASILVLFILVPLTGLLTARKASLAWLVWTILSLWVVLNAVRFTTLAFPERHSPTRALVVVMIAVVNMVLSLGLALLPTAWISSLR